MDKMKFVNKANSIHNGKYDYSKVEYKGAKEKVCIICPIHGEFWQTPSNHTHKTKPKGCPKCNGGIRGNKSEFIEKAKKVHGDKYDYSKVEYINNHTKVCITCLKHGEFWQTPAAHLRGQGCKFCVNDVYDTISFIKKANVIHNSRYCYSNVCYSNSHTKIAIKCNECGNIFYQTPNDHLCGKGCPFCKKWVLEEKIKTLLEKEKIPFIRQCGKDVLNWIGRQRLDFYLPKHNIAIECQGEQHFKPKNGFGGEEEFKKTTIRDKIKKENCNKNDIKILYFSDLKWADFFLGEKIYKNENELLNVINNI